MRYSSQYVIPDTPPAELLAELDAAALVLDELTARAAELTLGMDAQTRGLRIDLHDDGKSHRLAPTQLLELLAGHVGSYAAAVKPRPDAEVAIVGAGVMGLATAWALARAGRSVVVCEQFEVGHVNGSSHGGSRIIRLSYPEERWVRLAQEAYPLWRELEAGWGRALLDQPGTLDLGDWQGHRDALAACGVPFEVLDRAETGRRFPIQLENGENGLFQPDGGIVYADLALQALLGCSNRCGRGPARANAGRVDRGRGRDGLARRLACEGRRCDGRCVGAGPRGRGCDADARDRVVLRLRRARAVGARQEPR